MLKESEVATYAPKIVCKACVERKKQKQDQAIAEEEKKQKWAREHEARMILGHGFDAVLIISLVIAFAGYVAFTVLTFLNQSSDDCMLYGFLTFLCPLLLFGCVHAIADAINGWRDTSENDPEAYTRDLSLIVGAGFALVNLAAFLPLQLTSGEGEDLFFLILMILGIVLSFTFVSQYLYGGVVREIFTAGGFTFKQIGRASCRERVS